MNSLIDKNATYNIVTNLPAFILHLNLLYLLSDLTSLKLYPKRCGALNQNVFNNK